MSKGTFAVLGLFDTPQALMDAVKALRTKKLGRLEAYTPYPLHGLEAALGLRYSPLTGMVLVMGILGAVTSFLFQWWMNAVDYPIPTGGKALLSWEAFIPVMFEVTVLFATFTAGLGMLFLLNRLPFFGHPVLSSKSIASITKDKFALSIEANKGLADAAAARKALLDAGAISLEEIPVPEPEPPLSLDAIKNIALSIAAACLAAGLGTYWVVKLFPTLPPMSHMHNQPRLDAQRASAFFKDGRGMRLPVDGTVARGRIPYTLRSPSEASALINPLPRTPEVLSLGRKIYSNHCAVCHGALGTGKGTLTAAYGAKPADLQAPAFIEASDGAIFHAISKGSGAMPSYAEDLSEDDRWACVHYVRVLQRAQNAKESDLP